jgi:hypothetical protein
MFLQNGYNLTIRHSVLSTIHMLLQQLGFLQHVARQISFLQHVARQISFLQHVARQLGFQQLGVRRSTRYLCLRSSK